MFKMKMASTPVNACRVTKEMGTMIVNGMSHSDWFLLTSFILLVNIEPEKYLKNCTNHYSMAETSMVKI